MSFVIESNAATAPSISNEASEINTVDDSYMPADPGMAPLSNEEADLPSWIDLKRFQIFSASGGNTLYANGFQQLKLIVVVQAVGLANEVVEISNRELASIQLLEAYSGTALPIDAIREGDDPTWKCALERHSKFEPFPHTGELLGPVTRGKGVFLKEFYVSSNSSEPIKLIAAITRSDGEAFYSEEASEFGHISLSTVPQPIYRKEQFRLKHLSTYSEATEHVAKVDRYVLDLILDQHHIKFVNCSLSAVLRARSDHPDYLGYYAVGYFKGRKVNHWQETSLETADSVATRHDEPGKVTLLMHFAKKGGRSQVRSDCLTARIFVQDMYGNQHEIDVAMNADNPSMIDVI